MARSVAWWVGGALLVCGIVGAVYLPPRGVPKWAEGQLYVPPPANQQRIRARDLGAAWQETNAAMLGMLYRDRLGPLLAKRRAQDQAGPVLVMEAAPQTVQWGEAMIQAALDTVWRRLDIGVSKVSVGVLMRERPQPAINGAVSVETGRYNSVFLLPDSTDRTTCLVVTPVPFFAANRNYLPLNRLAWWATNVLGPCAFYARFGVPSLRVEQWLARRQFDVAISPRWDHGPERAQQMDWMSQDLNNRFWWWGQLYSYNSTVLGCFAGRANVCARGFARGDSPVAGSVRPHVVVPNDPWDSRKVSLIGAESFLADLLRQVGDERFQDFWNTTLPVDSALTVALQKPVGEYTVSWLRQFSDAPHFGAGTTWLNAVLALSFALILVGLAMLGQGRREVK